MPFQISGELEEKNKKINYLYREKVNTSLIKITLENNFEITKTFSHKLYTSNGWKNDILLNDDILCYVEDILSFSKVINNIRESLIVNSRKIRIVYFVPVCSALLDNQDWLIREGKIGNNDCWVWGSKWSRTCFCDYLL